jgi:thiamine-phosphate pyrophosphorylase
VRGLYLVTDRGLCGARPLEEVVAEAVAGGVACVQLREKDLSIRRFLDLAQRLKGLLAPAGVPLIVNDRLDVALAGGADGVHLGQEDMPCGLVRSILGPKAIVGLSVETWEDVERAQDLDVDYLGVSPVFQTPTKTDTKAPWGLEGLRRIRAFSRHPLVAIGGLNAGNAQDAVRAGAEGIAVVSAICASPAPREAARELARIIQAAMTGNRAVRR